jgi:hypothetical protein
VTINTAVFLIVTQCSLVEMFRLLLHTLHCCCCLLVIICTNKCAHFVFCDLRLLVQINFYTFGRNLTDCAMWGNVGCGRGAWARARAVRHQVGRGADGVVGVGGGGERMEMEKRSDKKIRMC